MAGNQTQIKTGNEAYIFNSDGDYMYKEWWNIHLLHLHINMDAFLEVILQ